MITNFQEIHDQLDIVENRIQELNTNITPIKREVNRRMNIFNSYVNNRSYQFTGGYSKLGTREVDVYKRTTCFFHTKKELMSITSSHPYNETPSVVFDRQQKIWTKLGSGDIIWGYNASPPTLTLYNTGVQCQNITQAEDGTYLFNSKVWCCEFGFNSAEQFDKDIWSIIFYTSLTASGGTGQPFVGIMWYGTTGQMSIRRRLSAGGTVTTVKTEKVFEYSDIGGTTNPMFLYIHDPTNGEYLYYKARNDTSIAWTLVASIPTGSTVNFRHVRLSASTGSSVTVYQNNFHNRFALCYLEDNDNGGYNYVPVSNLIEHITSDESGYWIPDNAVNYVLGTYLAT